jgi:malate synthase
MDAILYELRDHSCALNAGRWDYIFSCIKRMGALLPDRSQVTMTVPFMRAYSQLLVKTCHEREAHAIGGMAAFIPSRRDPEVNALALAKVKEDKSREAGDGFDGTWVAHPDLVPVAKAEFDAVLGKRPNQLERKRDDVAVDEEQLVDFDVPGGAITDEGLRVNVSVGVRYLDAWLQGVGAAAIDNLMEDAATAEISRAQVWSWVQAGRFDEARVRAEVARVDASEAAKKVFADVALAVPMPDFLTSEAYTRLE